MTEKVKVGVIGCGNISGIYFKNLPRFEHVELAACADLDVARAKAKAEEYKIPQALSVEQMLADRSISAIVNLTVPAAHASVGIACLESGKHVYNEKPLAVEREDAQQMIALAKRKGLRIGCAPDTVLGGGCQTARKLIEDGVIGEPIAANAFMVGHGVDSWHPNPAFYYARGGGPMFDMGPYYLSALINLIGPVARVTASARITFKERNTVHAGIVPVTTPTHISGIMDFANGAVGTIITSFDVWGANLPRIEIHGTEASLSVPDPNGFGGKILLKKGGADYKNNAWEEIALTHPYQDNWRGLGVADMVKAVQSGREHRANEAIAYHVLDLFHCFHEASEQGRHIVPQSKCTKPRIMPHELAEGTLDA